MAITSHTELQYLLPDDYKWIFDKLGGGTFGVIRNKHLVVKVYQRPSFAIAGIQCHSTVISLYKMRVQDGFQRAAGTILKNIKKITPCLEDWVAPMQCTYQWRPFFGEEQKIPPFQGAFDGTHVKLQFLASMAIHNFIRRDAPNETMFVSAINPDEYVF